MRCRRALLSGRTVQRGAAYLALLLAVALTQALLAAGASLWSHTQRRERETQLLWAGERIRRAIVDYHRHPDGQGRHEYPRSLQDLVDDQRHWPPRRHLRRLYHDPMLPGGEWGLLHDRQGRLVGVFSRAEGLPIRRVGFGLGDESFEDARQYRDWRFVAAAAADDPRGASPASERR